MSFKWLVVCQRLVEVKLNICTDADMLLLNTLLGEKNYWALN